MDLKRLCRIAERMGIQVVEGELPGRRRGLYSHSRGLIVLREGLSYPRARSTLAHEIGHASYGHEPASDVVTQTKQERLADEWAAKTLINPVEYALAEVMYGTHIGLLANQLDVTPRLIRVWRGMVLGPGAA
ncbi:ImmA/IrrE family metallo-endopeptidase [Rhodococcus hoagii]|nr:ImmA/IrrE family metallo-endopeptidase [Prescottella equi]